MNTKLFSAVFSMICLLGATAVASAQNPTEQPKAVVFSTTPKLVVAKLKNGEQDVHDVRGKANFTVIAANSDDTVAGTLNYMIPDADRQKIASLSGKPLNSVPSNVTRKDVLAYFQEGTLYPLIQLEIKPIDFDVAGLKLTFSRIVVDINGRDGGAIPRYSKEEMEALFTTWAKQISNKRQRRGVISRMNKVINGEADQ